MKAASKAKEKYNKANYDRVAFRVDKDMKFYIEVAAKRCGMSLNAFVSRAVLDEVFKTLADYDDELVPEDVSSDEWVRYRRHRWNQLPDEIKPVSKRLIGSRTDEEECYLLEASRMKVLKFDKKISEDEKLYE